MCGADVASAKNLGLRLDKTQGRSPKGKIGIAVTVCQCRSCGLIFNNPQPAPAAIVDHYGLPPEAYWNSVSYEPEPDYFASELSTAKRLIGKPTPIRAIDIGLGLGKAASVMRNNGFDVYGIEPSKPFFDKAIELLGNEEGHFQLTSIEEADFQEGAFDFVSFGAVLEHLYDPAAAIAKALFWLRPGGIIQAEIPNARHAVSKFINAYYRVLGTSFVTNTSPMHVPYHLYEFTLASFLKNGRSAGYSVAESWVKFYGLSNIPALLHSPFKWWMDRNQSGLQLTVSCARIEIKPSILYVAVGMAR